MRRHVVHREHDGQPAHIVIASRIYDAAIDDVWDAITNPERIPRWFLPVTGELRLGGRYQLEGNAGGEITTCKPPRHLAVTWEFGGAISWVDVHLDEGADGSTGLRLEHLVPDDPHWREFGPGAVGIGWDLTLLGLDHHLTTDEPRGDADELMASETAKELMRRSNDGWLQASIASGTPEDEATQQAERTLAAYLGG